jgi:hypothetical protein
MSLFDAINTVAGGKVDPGAYLKQELEEGLTPITERVDRLEKKLDIIILTLGRVEAGLKAVQPLVDFISNIPKPKFFK